MTGTLSELQRRILVVLAAIEPRWRPTGGGALAGFHAGHRETRDLDLFWSKVEDFHALVSSVEHRLVEAGFEVRSIQSSRSFARRMVVGESESCVLDLVLDLTAVVDPPVEEKVHGVAVLVDSPQEIFTNKLCALLS